MQNPDESSWNDALMADFRSHDGQITQGRLAGAKMLLMTSVGAKTDNWVPPWKIAPPRLFSTRCSANLLCVSTSPATIIGRACPPSGMTRCASPRRCLASTPMC